MDKKIFAKSLRNNMTEAEKHLWYHLRKRNVKGVKFRRQQAVGKYVVDFISFRRRLIIELDGGQHAKSGQYDKERDDFLRSKGYIVLRFWNHDVLNKTESVIEMIYNNCNDIY